MSWINYVKDSNLVAEPFLYENKSGGKGFYAKRDDYRSIVLGGGFFGDFAKGLAKHAYNEVKHVVSNPITTLLGLEDPSSKLFRQTSGGQSYPQYYIPINYPPYHQPKRVRFYD